MKKSKIRKILAIGCLGVFAIGASLYLYFLRKTYNDNPIAHTRLGDSHNILEAPGESCDYERITTVSGSILVPIRFQTRKLISDQVIDLPSSDKIHHSTILLSDSQSHRSAINLEAQNRYNPVIEWRLLWRWKSDGYKDLEHSLSSRLGLMQVMLRSIILSNYKRAEISRVTSGKLRGFLIQGKPEIRSTAPRHGSSLYLYNYYLFDDKRAYRIAFFVHNQDLTAEQVRDVAASFTPLQQDENDLKKSLNPR